MPPEIANLLALSHAIVDSLQRGKQAEAIELLGARGHEIERLRAAGINLPEADMDEVFRLDAEIQAHLMQARQAIMHEMASLGKQNNVSNAYRSTRTKNYVNCA